MNEVLGHIEEKLTAEHIRQRRLELSTFELNNSNIRVIDNAVKYRVKITVNKFIYSFIFSKTKDCNFVFNYGVVAEN